MGGRKPSIVGAVRLFHRKLNIVKELKQELEYQIHSGLEPEVVSVTQDEFKRTIDAHANTFAPARPINNPGLFENVPDHRTPIPISFGNRFPTPCHSGPFQAYCPNNWSNLANVSFEPSNRTPCGPVYTSSQTFDNQNYNPYRQRNIHRSVKLPDIRSQKFDGDPLKWNEWSSMFSLTIHNNEDITDNERMSYLQSLVIGPAKDCISGFFATQTFTPPPFKSSTDALETRKTLSVL